MVLECRGRTEHGHHGIADEFLDRTARGIDLGRHRVVEPVEEEPCALRVLLGAKLCRTDQIGEEDGRKLSLLNRRIAERRRPRSHRLLQYVGI